MIEGFEAAGYILSAMRTIAYGGNGPALARVDVGRLTVGGDPAPNSPVTPTDTPHRQRGGSSCFKSMLTCTRHLAQGL